MPTIVRNPSSDEAVTGTWSGTASNRFSLVNDFPDNAAGADVVTCTALSGGTGRLTFNFTSPGLPSDATSIVIFVRYYDSKAGNQAANANGTLKVGGTYYTVGGVDNPNNGVFSERIKTFSTNPATGSAWTVDQINGVAASNNLQAFGFVTTDTTPNVSFPSVRMEISYVRNVTLTAATGTFTHTGKDVILTPPGIITQISWTEIGSQTPFTGEKGDFALTGVAASLKRGWKLTADTGAITLTRNDVSFGVVTYVSWTEIVSTANRIIADVGTRTVTGNAANLLFGRKLTANVGTYQLTGMDINAVSGTVQVSWIEMVEAVVLAASQGTFTLTGVDATLDLGNKVHMAWTEVETFTPGSEPVLVAEPGSFALVVYPSESDFDQNAQTSTNFTIDTFPATMSVAHKITADKGTFTHIGQDVVLISPTNTALTAESKTLTLTTPAAGLYFGRTISAAVGTFTQTRVDAALLKSESMAIERGTFSSTWIPNTFYWGHRHVAGHGSFALTGRDIITTGVKQLTAATGSFTVSDGGTNLIYREDFPITADVGNFTLSAPQTVFDRKAPYDVGSFTMTGVAATFPRTYRLDARGRRFTLSGQIFGPMVFNTGVGVGISFGIGL